MPSRLLCLKVVRHASESMPSMLCLEEGGEVLDLELTMIAGQSVARRTWAMIQATHVCWRARL